MSSTCSDERKLHQRMACSVQSWCSDVALRGLVECCVMHVYAPSWVRRRNGRLNTNRDGGEPTCIKGTDRSITQCPAKHILVTRKPLATLMKNEVITPGTTACEGGHSERHTPRKARRERTLLTGTRTSMSARPVLSVEPPRLDRMLFRSCCSPLSNSPLSGAPVVLAKYVSRVYAMSKSTGASKGPMPSALCVASPTIYATPRQTTIGLTSRLHETTQ